MSELAKEKLYRKELIKAGATGNNNLERIRSLQNGGGGTQALDDLLTGQSTNLESNVSGSILGMAGITAITNLSLPNATSIESNAFVGCNDLITVSLPNATVIKDSAFAECGSLTTVSLPNATTIEGGAFDGCEALTSITLPNATSIGNRAFAECVYLTTVSLPNTTVIDDFAFLYCEALTTVSLPNTTSIGTRAFAGCMSLTSITLGANQVCSIGIMAFDNIQNTVTVYVPSSLIEQYKIAINWRDYFNNNQVTFIAITE